MADKPQPQSEPKFNAEIIKERLQTMAAWLEQTTTFVHALDWLGASEKHPAGSDEQELAKVRDDVDLALSNFLSDAYGTLRFRAEFTHCIDLLADAAGLRQGNGPDALHLMRRLHALDSEEISGPGDPGPLTFPDSFAWDTYLRVKALARLVEEFPRHLRHGARQMHGWPMIVSHHLDCRPEFQRVAKRLELGAGYPLDVGPRKRRGAETPLLHYLKPLVWQIHVGRKILKKTSGEEGFKGLVRYVRGHELRGPEPTPEIVAIFKQVPDLPPLTQKTAPEWSRKVIVPLIMLEDAGTLQTCDTPALRNIWRHRSVKSRATFQSRLHSAVTDTLQRFGRPG